MPEFCLEVEGAFACFTRPEFKVERVSYEVPTPSAARSIFEAILWKPAIEWRVRRIEVLAPIRWTSIRRNELSSKIPARTVEAAMRGSASPPAVYIEEDRQQRAGLLLRNVHYRLHAEMRLVDSTAAGGITKHAEMFRRRAQNGQCVNQPYLGTREFGCRFRLVDGTSHDPSPIEDSRELGLMLFDLDFWSGSLRPLVYRPRLERGTIVVPDRESGEVLR